MPPKGKPLPKGEPPAFITTIQGLTVDAGQPMRLESKVKGQNVQCTWYKKKMEIKPDSNFITKFDRGMASLELKSVSAGDSGDYTLTVRNEFGEKSAVASVLVKGGAPKSAAASGKNRQEDDEDAGPTDGPKFGKKPQNHTCIDGDTCVVEFTVIHDVMPEVRFSKGKREIKPGTKVKFDIDAASKTVRISISKLKFSDEGKYCVQLLKPDGQSNEDAFFNIYVKDPKDSNLDFRALLKHKDHKKRKSGDEDPDWGKLKHREKESSQEENIDWPDLKHREKKKKEPPSFKIPLVDVTVEEGVDKEVTFMAEFTVKNPKLVKWQRNRMEIFKGSKDEIIHETYVHKLRITKLSAKDSGRYTLTVDGVSTSANLLIKPKRKEYKFSRRMMESAKWKEGKSAELSLELPEPHLDVIWLKNGTQISADSKLYCVHQSGTTYTLKVSAATLDMAGLYECQVHGDTSKCMVSIDETDYEFMESLTGHEVLQHEACELTVLLNHERPKVRWFRGPKEDSLTEIKPSEKYELISNKLHRTLRIKDCVESDAGLYWCHLGNETSFQRCYASLAIAPEVRFVERLGAKQMAVEKHRVVLETLVENPHNRPVSWYKNGQPITDPRYITKGGLVLDMVDSVQISKSNFKGAKESHLYKYMLTIENCDYVDSASYTCKVGDQETQGTLTITKSMKPPVLDFSMLTDSVTVRVGKKVHLSIPYSANPEPTVTWLFQSSPVLEHMKCTQTSSLIDFLIESASRSDSGMYRVTATNDVGEMWREMMILVIDKAGLPRNLSVAEIWASNVLLRWEAPADDGGYPIGYYTIEMMNVKKSTSWTKIGQSKETEFRVRNLTENSMYRFRVCAHTMDGQGHWTELDKDVTAADPYDPPGGPDGVKVEEFTYHNARLVWSAPASDGGSPITSYVVEMRTGQDSRWTEVGSTGKCEYSIEQLKESTEYMFRVIAVNKMGRSAPALTTASITTKKKLRKPQLDTRDWNDVIKKKEQPFTLSCKYFGVPPPTIEWFKGKSQTLDTLKSQ
ncbi:unc-22 [Bugula neritina]|uniref:Unc-22 n=1 Tax=Bugula neritina TaxID=10212 RepID=A0A7J7IZ78_BUGNE|nr:unc-22 [Bugula neritina]